MSEKALSGEALATMEKFSSEDLALLKSLPSIGHPGATLGSAWRDRIRRLRANQYVVVEGDQVWRSYHADVLLITIQSIREQTLAEVADDLENAATDCDGHTPYSILMALAKATRDLAATPPQESDPRD